MLSRICSLPQSSETASSPLIFSSPPLLQLVKGHFLCSCDYPQSYNYIRFSLAFSLELQCPDTGRPVVSTHFISDWCHVPLYFRDPFQGKWRATGRANIRVVPGRFRLHRPLMLEGSLMRRHYTEDAIRRLHLLFHVLNYI